MKFETKRIIGFIICLLISILFAALAYYDITWLRTDWLIAHQIYGFVVISVLSGITALLLLILIVLPEELSDKIMEKVDKISEWLPIQLP